MLRLKYHNKRENNGSVTLVKVQSGKKYRVTPSKNMEENIIAILTKLGKRRRYKSNKKLSKKSR